MSINALKKKKADALAAARDIQAKLDDADANYSAEKRAEFEQAVDKHIADAEQYNEEIAEAEAAAEASRKRAERISGLASSGGSGRQTEPDRPGSTLEVKEPEFTNDPMKGFGSPKEFFGTVADLAARNEAGRKAAEDPRVKYLATAGSDEQSGQSDPYGGLLVPVGMSGGVRSTGADRNPLLGAVTQVPMQTRSVEIIARVDKNHSSSVSGGLSVSRRDETDGITSSRMEMEKITLKATGLFGLAYSTRELMQDSPQSITALLQQGFADEFPATIYEEMISGNTPGKLEGIINTPATISVAKESMQTADTINGTNLLKMRERAWRYGEGSFWLANYDTLRQLIAAHSTLTNDDYPLFIHGNGTDVPDTLLGRPIYFNEFCSTLGDLGDIILVSQPAQYLYGVYQPLRSEESMHVRFENHEQVFKFWTENAGAPWWRSALTPKNGANTLSPFVTLAARA
jgi:HK97 family phage major capsid protein